MSNTRNEYRPGIMTMCIIHLDTGMAEDQKICGGRDIEKNCIKIQLSNYVISAAAEYVSAYFQFSFILHELDCDHIW